MWPRRAATAAGCNTSSQIPRFERRFFDPTEPVTAIGDGSPGGKARGLLQIRALLSGRPAPPESAGVVVDVPALTVVQTGVFERFMHGNGLWDVVRAPRSDQEIAIAFQAADFPAEHVGDLRAIVEQVRIPLAVRSSSLLEDALHHPFAGVYATKMIPNDRHDADSRFRRLLEAIKLVYASTFFAGARQYLTTAGCCAEDERMAVIVQEIVGRRHGARFYPDVSGVARTYSFYRSGSARPEDGFASLALGLGKTIVDGGVSWNYSPAHPRATPPFSSVAELLDQTQKQFWAVSMTGTPRYDPVSEVEYLVSGTLADAEADGTLRFTASSYDPGSDRLHAGLRGHGPRALTFAPLLVNQGYPANAVVRDLLAISQKAAAAPVEIEFAFTFAPDTDAPARCGFLQVRPMAVSTEPVIVDDAELDGPAHVVASLAALGNGVSRKITDIVLVRRDRFDAGLSRAIAGEIGQVNADLVAEHRPYLLIGFGRWGSADPWLGIPTDWASIGGAQAIVETSLPDRRVDPSQGSHFFHNLSSFHVLYFTVRPDIDPPIDWEWLESLPVAGETAHVRHVRAPVPLVIKVDGRTGRGVILRDAGSPA